MVRILTKAFIGLMVMGCVAAQPTTPSSAESTTGTAARSDVERTAEQIAQCLSDENKTWRECYNKSMGRDLDDGWFPGFYHTLAADHAGITSPWVKTPAERFAEGIERSHMQ